MLTAILIAAVVGSVAGLRRSKSATLAATPPPAPAKAPPPSIHVAPVTPFKAPAMEVPAHPFSTRPEPPDLTLPAVMAGVQLVGKAAGVGASAASAFGVAGASTVSVLPVAVDAGILAIAAVDAFGGDFSIPTYATTPQLDATTPGGQILAHNSAILIRQSLADTGGASKFSLKAGGVVDKEFIPA